MADKTVAQKARVKPDATIAVINRVPGVVESLGLPKSVAFGKPAGAAEKLDMRPLDLVGINETWSAFRLRRGQVPS